MSQATDLFHGINRAVGTSLPQTLVSVAKATVLEPAMRKLVAVLLVVTCLSGVLMAERPTALLYAIGAVMLNGMPAAMSMSVFAADRTETADASAVSVMGSGFSLVVDSNSSIQYQSDGFTFLRGRAIAKTPAGMSAHAGPLSVSAKGKSALFDISGDRKTVLVASREGTLTLIDGIDTATLGADIQRG